MRRIEFAPERKFQRRCKCDLACGARIGTLIPKLRLSVQCPKRWYARCSECDTTLKALLVTFAASLLSLLLVPGTQANLVQNGDFTSVTYSGALPVTVLFGEFGSGYPSTTPAPQLSVTGWSTAGYNYVYTPATIDQGTTTGANAGQPNQAPAQFNAANGYGNTYMWGTNNGGTTTITAPPGGGNIIAGDGAYETAAITQTITGLTVGQTYVLKFSWAGGQQQSFSGITTEAWAASLGAQSFTTSTVTTPSHGFSGWMQETFYYTATSTSETLSFLAVGTPNGEPPFALLANVDLEVVPELSNWMIFAGFGVSCIVLEGVRRRRKLAPSAIP